MTELVRAIARSLVDNPDAVEVTESAGKQQTTVIGKQGRIAKALRTVVKAAATKAGQKVVVEIVQ